MRTSFFDALNRLRPSAFSLGTTESKRTAARAGANSEGTAQELMPALAAKGGLCGTDVWLLLFICALLLGVGAFSGRPLSMHESRLPELAREIVQGKSSWILPLSGGRPWLERPPLPHWFAAGSMLLFGRTEPEWVARFPAALMGTSIVLLGAWMAAQWFGRNMGLLSGAIIATSYELYDYSSLAEDDIFLAAVAVAAMAMFVKAEQSQKIYSSFRSIFSWRPWPILLMFLLLGLTNWAKGPLVGAMPVVATIGVYLLWNADFSRLRRYLWFWGILIFLLLTIAWPLIALKRYPDIWGNWVFDFTGNRGGEHDSEFEHPFWYYLAMMPMILAPWYPAIFSGLFVTAKRAWKTRGSPERLLWCWALVGLIVLSAPARKHHHYFLPLMVPWGILAAQGLVPVARFLFSGKGPDWSRKPWFGLLAVGVPGVIAILALRKKIVGPGVMPAILAATWLACVWLFYTGQWRKSGRIVMSAILLGFIVTAGWLQIFYVARDKGTLAELQFLRDIPAKVPAGQLLTVDSDGMGLEFFRMQYYLPDNARLLHNLSFLRSKDITASSVYIVARASDEKKLTQLGTVDTVLQTSYSTEIKTPGSELRLFHLIYSPTAVRGITPPYVGVMQAMDRKEGPWCGDPL